MIYDNFGRPVSVAIDAPANPWGIRQAAVLPKRVTAPVPKAPPAAAPLPRGILPVGWNTVNVDPIVNPGPGTALVPFTAPASSTPTSSTPASSPASGGGQGTGGCLLCNTTSGAPSPVASTAVSTSGGASTPAVASASILGATSAEMPWWILVLGAALAGVLVNKAFK